MLSWRNEQCPAEEIHQHSGWLIPLAFGCAILLLSGLFLGWYLRPGPQAPAAPTGQSNIVELTVRGAAFAIPANYIESPAARAGGEQDSLALAALFPSWRGYSDSEAQAVSAAMPPDSPVIHLNLRARCEQPGCHRRGWSASTGPISPIPMARPVPSA